MVSPVLNVSYSLNGMTLAFVLVMVAMVLFETSHRSLSFKALQVISPEALISPLTSNSLVGDVVLYTDSIITTINE